VKSSVAPAILGTMLEEHFITKMIKSDGRFLGFFERPIAACLGIATILIWLWPLVSRLRARRGAAAAA
jgi:TctA family transporter